MKRLLLCAIASLLTTIFAFAQGDDLKEISGYCGKDGENIKWTVNTLDSTLVFEGSGEMENYSYSGGRPWENYKSYIKYVTIAEGILNISDNSLSGIGAIHIELPSSLRGIGKNSMVGTGISHITLPDSLTTIGGGAFASSKIESITIPSLVTTINNSVFSGCKELNNVVLPDSLSDIGIYAFGGCSSLKSIALPNNLKTIGDEAFSTSALESVAIPPSISVLNYRCFYKCSKLIEVSFPDGLFTIGRECFSECTNLSNLTLPESLFSIGHECFYGCEKLKSVTLPQQLNSVESSAFRNCNALTDLEIKGLTQLGERAFSGCTSLKSVILPEGFSDAYLSIKFSDSQVDYGTFAGCDSLPPLYNATTFFYMPHNGAETFTVPDGITTIAKYAFSFNNTIKEIILPSSISTIGNSAFRRSGVKKINLPPSLTQLGSYAFASSAIEEIDLSGIENLSLIGEGVFSGSAISRIISPNKIGRCTKSMFSGCKNLEEFELYSSVSDHAFGGCENLKRVIVKSSKPDGWSIGREAFSGCQNLEEIDLSNVYSIGYSAFRNCIKLKKIEVAHNVKREAFILAILAEAFAECTSLDSVVIGPCNVNEFHISAFEGCNNLKSIVVMGETVLPITEFQRPGYHQYDGLYNGQSFSDFNLPFDNTVFTMLGYIADDLLNDECYFWYLAHINKIYETFSGKCGDKGDNIMWSLDTKERILRIVGSGNMRLPEDSVSLTWKNRSSAVKEIVLADSIESICPYAFSGCAVQKISFNQNLKEIGDYAFSSCSSLEDIILPSSLEIIGENAFYGCYSLNRVVMNEGLKRIGKSAFLFCSMLEEINLPSSLESLGEGAFVYCTSLISATLPKNITAIPPYTFSQCSNLKKITLPPDAVIIGADALSQCNNIVDIFCPAVTPPHLTYGYQLHNGITLHIPQGTASTYRNHSAWGACKVDDYYAYVNISTSIGSGSFIVEEDTIKTPWIRYYILGEPWSLKIIPDDYYYIHNVSVNGVDFTSELIEDRLSFDVLQESKDIKVTFAPYKFELSLSVQGKGNIRLKDYDVESSGKFTVTHNDSIEMIFTPKEGYRLDSVLVDGTNITDQVIDGKYAVAFPTGEVDIKVFFGKESYKLTYMIGDEIYKEVVYEYEAVIIPEPTPEGDYVTFEWADLPATMPAHDVVVYATFETDIKDVLNNPQDGVRIYSTSGKQLERLQRGVNIVHRKDGEVLKVLRN